MRPLISLFLLAFGAITETAVNFATPISGKTDPQPNILLVLCDDLGADEIGWSGNALSETPNIDRLAQASARFSEFTVNPVCAPSRATLLTGRNFLRTGVSHVHGGKDYLHLDEILLPQLLKQAGYATATWGKWHNGYTQGYLPWQRGFDEVYMADLYKHRNTSGTNQRSEREEHQKWADEVIADRAVDFIKRHRDQPFFAFMSSLTPHGRHDAPLPLVRKHQAKGISEELSKIYAMIEFLDTQVGRVLDCLESEGLADNTIVLFLSDNGPNHDGHLAPEERDKRKEPRMLRGWKGDIWEGGVRSPLFIRWPRSVPANDHAAPCQMADLLPTLLEAAGANLDDLPDNLDGTSLLPLLIDKTPYPQRPIFNYANPGWPPAPDRPYSPMGMRDEYRPQGGERKLELDPKTQVISLRDDPFKLLLNAELNTKWSDSPIDQFFLVNLADDPRESQDVKDRYPDKFAELRDKLLKQFQTIAHEDHSFAAPQIVVNHCNAKSLTIPATAVSDLSSDLTNTVHAIYGWRTKGQYAEYTLQVAQPGAYRVEPVWERPWNADCKVALVGQVNKNTRSIVYLAAGSQVLRIQLQPRVETEPNALRSIRLSSASASHPKDQ
ncbi:sulfatase-like hydrolase/transferase [Pelagicoccus enzymogenes]|uniref:sulfatase-like hydrolase/transferase n=1 Tax=Pelagicoccus enzymogenes TaxID=2773457 RepID=UPI00280D6472|nr:sulfatase-like hydrolase/transferase [Pelagicoccus enzymogenes]MDQ8199432.1 sulfatase-like hydrolase/transferase [Pelagicoccus enzymogenes]